ncbi:uncharacterized protein LOC113873840 [Abrus precatorius]|uniref:Uncharacterized protein LOC113873840 n=1 Tax=Abrus precatorius TaxID=3816 RepID=A0A8B8MJA7_ABRPR|nr:uncharacterized protein LOC113873840 [Abrus precatorius]
MRDNMSFGELCYWLTQNIEFEFPKIVESIVYRCPISIFGGFTQYYTVPIINDADVAQMFQIHHQYHPPTLAIELYVVFKEIAINIDEEDEDAYASTVPNREVEWINVNNESGDSEGEYGSGELSEDEDVDDDDYANLGHFDLDGDLYVGKQFANRKTVIRAIKCYSIANGVDYKVVESEPSIFYCKYVRYEIDYGWLLRATFRKNEFIWEIRKYNGPHTCTRGRISQDHTKLDSDTIAECIKPMVESDPSFKIKLVIGEIQSRYGYTITYRKAWMEKQKAIEKVYGQWEASFEALPQWCAAMCDCVRGSVVQLDVVDAYRVDELVPNVKIFCQVFWTFGPCIRAFRHCKPLVQVDVTHLYGKYKEVLLVAVAQDGNQNILPIVFAIVEGETTDA